MTQKGHCHSYDGAQWNMFHCAPQKMFQSAPTPVASVESSLRHIGRRQ